jgi:hypothetical protein
MSPRVDKTTATLTAPTTPTASADVVETMRGVQTIARELADAPRQEVAKVKAELEPQRQRAEALLAEATACQKEFGADIEKLCAFDWESLAGRVVSHRLSPTYWAARELHVYLPNLIRTCKDVLEQIAGLNPSSLAAKIPGEIRRAMRDCSPGGPLRERVQERLAILKKFAAETLDAAQTDPGGKLTWLRDSQPARHQVDAFVNFNDDQV